MNKQELEIQILKVLIEDDDNDTNLFWKKIDNKKLGTTKLKIAQTINELEEMGYIEGTKQHIGLKSEVDFAGKVSITIKGRKYFEGNYKR
ncbi:YjcQ family protein [Clostridium sp. AWRP]|uniref:YjcQ family protein n=1 Tax=Clostridium sp. AWRP TaxID=2212991 RepID=UPI000FD77014|nr:YjcQ family protein [Clostridium sp. AWRP]AZV56786.1 hypothetical protein DMR38_09335 [Clostridium sp. AWRP]